MSRAIPNAAGISIKDKDLESFHNYANEKLKDIDFGEKQYDVNFICKANESYLKDLIVDIDKYKNIYSQQNDEPFIYIHDINITSKDIQIIGKNADTVKIEKFGIYYMKFHAKDFIQDLAQYDDIKLEVVGRANINEWNNVYTPQIFIDDYQIKDGRFSF